MGHLVFPDNTTYIQVLCKLEYNKKRFYKARAYLILPLKEGQLPHASSKKWYVGTFHCNDISHNRDDHVYSLKASDSGKVDIFEDHDEEEIVINVEATHVSGSTFNKVTMDEVSMKKPKVTKFDSRK